MSQKSKITAADFKVLDAHIQKGREVARALDAKADVLPHAMKFTSVQFEDFIGELTPKRFQLLRMAAKGEKSIAELATASKRDQSAVSKDIARLSRLGLVKVEARVNAGHGVKKVVTPIAESISIQASLVGF